MLFQNPSNDYVEKVAGGLSWLWAFLFGPVYWVVKGVWTHALICFLVWPFARNNGG